MMDDYKDMPNASAVIKNPFAEPGAENSNMKSSKSLKNPS
jgi:hypothetical protein